MFSVKLVSIATRTLHPDRHLELLVLLKPLSLSSCLIKIHTPIYWTGMWIYFVSFGFSGRSQHILSSSHTHTALLHTPMHTHTHKHTLRSPSFSLTHTKRFSPHWELWTMGTMNYGNYEKGHSDTLWRDKSAEVMSVSRMTSLHMSFCSVASHLRPIVIMCPIGAINWLGQWYDGITIRPQYNKC